MTATSKIAAALGEAARFATMSAAERAAVLTGCADGFLECAGSPCGLPMSWLCAEKAPLALGWTVARVSACYPHASTVEVFEAVVEPVAHAVAAADIAAGRNPFDGSPLAVTALPVSAPESEV